MLLLLVCCSWYWVSSMLSAAVGKPFSAFGHRHTGSYLSHICWHKVIFDRSQPPDPPDGNLPGEGSAAADSRGGGQDIFPP
jgi:hypothetical protein